MRTLIDRIDTLPSAPASAQRILALVTQPAPDMAELIEAMEMDPAVSLRVLRHAHSAEFNRFEKVDDIRQAVMFLGTDVVCNLALCVCVREGLLKSFESGDPAVSEIWRHSLACACAAKLIAERFRPGLAGRAFAAGLLHDCGKLALLSAGGDAYAALLSDEFLIGNQLLKQEQESFGADHCLAGKWLLERWRLPAELVDAAWMHHQPASALLGLGESAQTSMVAALSDRLAHESLGTVHPGTDPRSMELASGLGLDTPAVLAAVREGVGRMFAQRAALFDLKEDAAAFYCNALGRANRRLGDANLNLSGKSRGLERDVQALRNVALAGVAIAKADIPQDVLAALAACMRDRFGAMDGFAGLCDPTLTACAGQAWGGEGGARPLAVRLTPSLEPVAEDAALLHPAVAANLSGLRTRASALHGPEGPPIHFLDGVAMVSLVAGGDVVGELLYLPSEGSIGEEERAAVSLLAQLAAQAFRRLELVARCEARSERLSEVMLSMQDLNEKLLKTQRLAAVGQLAAGAAHEINNPLAIISARAQLMAMRATDEATKKGLRQMVDQIDRISAILGSLMDFARPASPRMESMNPREVMDRVLGLTEGGLASQGVTIRRDYKPGIPDIKADPRQMEQVLLNLVLNAQHAMESTVEGAAPGGTLTAGISFSPVSDSVTFSVADTGMGILPENKDKIFDPFFTTKGEGKGTGLGLSTAYGIVQAHKGRIDVESAPGHGSVFNVVLPRDFVAQTPAQDIPAEGRTPRQAVLVVDDERHIRDILREALESKGYAVEVAEDGEKALHLLRENRYRLMILDIRMPSRDGLSLLREAGSFAQSGMPVLVLTGLASEEEILEARSLGVVACLRKPFQVDALLAEVGKLLDGGPRP
ncbi:HDOD domain-containing protein [Fundidesulfovibrio soli]|uniref:HDOD domain-containing protein n=1 Tax=Fundidesulfovibrio soli TaxID=2922716 RepID=UPI001FAEEA08|nr:HDOD domain-containing protein [Fundidesulfovibrio soli]